MKILSPGGFLSLPRGYIHVLNHEENCIKSGLKDIFLKLVTNEWSDKTFLLTTKFCRLGTVCPWPGAVYLYKIMTKNCIKSDFKEIFLKLATNNRSDKMFLWTSKFHRQGVVSPCPGAIYMYKIMKKNCMKSDFKEIFLKLVANDGCNKRFLFTSKFRSLPLISSYIHLLNQEKMCIKSEIEEILFKLATNDHSDKAFLLISKFWPEWVVCPYPRAMFKLLFLNNRWF